VRKRLGKALRGHQTLRAKNLYGESIEEVIGQFMNKVKGDKKDGIGEEEMGKIKMAWNNTQIEVIKQNGNIMRF
jgi:hypothetical protein